MALAARRTLSKVKSSAIMPRQPSVPNLTAVLFPMFLEQFFAAICGKLFDYFADILRMVPRSDKNSVFRLDHNKVFHADERNEFLRAVNIVAMRIQWQTARTLNDVFIFIRKIC